MTTYYYIVAFLFFPWMTDPYIMINTETRYKNYRDCNTTMAANRHVLTQGLTAMYPGLKKYSIRCLDHETLYILQRSNKNKRHQGT